MSRRSPAVWTADTVTLIMRAGGRRPSRRTWAHLVGTGPLPFVALLTAATVVSTCVVAPVTVADRYAMLVGPLIPSRVLLVVGLGLAGALLTVLVAHLAIRSRTTVAQNVMQLSAASAVGIGVPLLERVATTSFIAAAVFIAWSVWPRLAVYLGLADDDERSADRGQIEKPAPDPGEEVMSMFDRLDFGRSWAPYVCRGCGTEIAYKDRFIRCPVCGIKFN